MKTIKAMEKHISKIKNSLQLIGDMHPGSLSTQYNICGKASCRCKDPENPKKHGPYYQLSYVLNGKSTSRFIKPEFVEQMKLEVDNYKKFKALVDDWKKTAAEMVKLKMDLAKQDLAKQSK